MRLKVVTVRVTSKFGLALTETDALAFLDLIFNKDVTCFSAKGLVIRKKSTFLVTCWAHS